MWALFEWVTAHLWVLVQFWVAQTIIAKITAAILYKIFGPIDEEGHLDLVKNCDKYWGARLITKALNSGSKNIISRVFVSTIKAWMRLCELVISMTRGILGVDKNDKSNS